MEVLKAWELVDSGMLLRDSISSSKAVRDQGGGLHSTRIRWDLFNRMKKKAGRQDHWIDVSKHRPSKGVLLWLNELRPSRVQPHALTSTAPRNARGEYSRVLPLASIGRSDDDAVPSLRAYL